MISSALRGLRILEQVGHASGPIGVTELSRLLDEAPGTVFRGLNALEGGGYIERFQSSSSYVLGPVTNQLHRNLLSRFVMRDFSLPYLDQIAFATGETASFIMPVGWYSLRLASAPGANDVHSASPVGEIQVLERTCAGRAILAGLPGEKLEAYLAWPGRTGAGIRPAKALRATLQTIGNRGFALEQTPFAPGRAAAAFAVRRGSKAIAAIAIEGPVLNADNPGDHDDLERWKEIVDSLEGAVRDCSATIEGPFAHLDPASITLKTTD